MRFVRKANAGLGGGQCDLLGDQCDVSGAKRFKLYLTNYLFDPVVAGHTLAEIINKCMIV